MGARCPRSSRNSTGGSSRVDRFRFDEHGDDSSGAQREAPVAEHAEQARDLAGVGREADVDGAVIGKYVVQQLLGAEILRG